MTTTINLPVHKHKAPPKTKYRKIEIAMVPPSYWKWRDMHWAEQRKLIQAAALLVKHAVDRAKIKKIPTPVLIRVEVYKVGGRKGDAHNLVTPVDKLFIDTLTAPKGNKTRGLGLIPDDTPDCMTLGSPTLHLGADEDKTVLTFIPIREKKKRRSHRKVGDEKEAGDV